MPRVTQLASGTAETANQSFWPQPFPILNHTDPAPGIYILENILGSKLLVSICLHSLGPKFSPCFIHRAGGKESFSCPEVEWQKLPFPDSL